MKASSVDAEFKHLVKGLLQNYRRLSKVQKEHDDLKQLIYDLELTTLKKKFLEEQISILEDHQKLMQEHYDVQNKIE